MDISGIKVKERVAEEFYNKFDVAYRRNNLKEASKNLWGCLKYLISALGLCEGKELDDKDIVDFLNKFESEITKDDINTIKAIHINSLRGTMDAEIFEIYKRKFEVLRNKLKNLIRGYLDSGNGLDSEGVVAEPFSDENPENSLF